MKIRQPQDSNKRIMGTLLRELLLPTAVGVIFYFSNPNPWFHFDYTFRVAEAFLQGNLGLVEKPPSWLNEFIPSGGIWYSVFPLGSVITMLPFALLKHIHLIERLPVNLLAALTASRIAFFQLRISSYYDIKIIYRLLLCLSTLLGSWFWINETFAGAWQLALGFAFLGLTGTIYYARCNVRPVLAGFYFSLAFGNRTELVLLAPIFLLFVIQAATQRERHVQYSLIRFSIFPVILGVLTLLYNYARFSSFSDFGYARIPGVLEEPWYAHGIFSLRYILLTKRNSAKAEFL